MPFRSLRSATQFSALLLALGACEASSFEPGLGEAPGSDGGLPNADASAPVDGGPAKGCLVDGELKPVGASFPASDGCNTCSCLESGQAVCTLRACPAPSGCGGLGGGGCSIDQFCEFPLGSACGAADVQGSCSTPPSACNRLYAPVCGCDGRSYANECLPRAARTSVAEHGECKRAGACKVDGDCPQADCACLDANQDGVCENHCPTLGCRAGSCVDVSQGVFCGGFAGVACGKGEFCDYGTSCGFADQSGTCQRLPQACDTVYDPVCGCDGKTYSNLCFANMAGVNAATRGTCGTGLAEGASCGGLVPVGTPTCTAGTFCQHQPGAACGAADAPGVCTAIPGACTLEYVPVCGCDGKTYGNRCAATAAQVGIVADGPCP